MLTDSSGENFLFWKKLDNNIQVAQFKSTANNGSKVYVKKFNALKSEPGKNITIFLLHDLGQYHGRYLAFINWVRALYPGISFVAMDFIGHGLSSGTRGHLESFNGLVSDFLLLLNHSTKAADEKWIVLGHGLGGLVALDLLNRFQEKIEDRIDGMILSNFLLKFPTGIMAIETQLNSMSNMFSDLMAQTRPIRLMKGSDILSDPTAILAYEHDPLVIQKPTFKTIKELQNKVSNIYQDSYFVGKPLLMLKSETDDSINSSGIDYFMKGIKKDLLTEKKYSLMKHDLYNENEREIVFKDIMNWMKMYEN